MIDSSASCGLLTTIRAAHVPGQFARVGEMITTPASDRSNSAAYFVAARKLRSRAVARSSGATPSTTASPLPTSVPATAAAISAAVMTNAGPAVMRGRSARATGVPAPVYSPAGFLVAVESGFLVAVESGFLGGACGGVVPGRVTPAAPLSGAPTGFRAESLLAAIVGFGMVRSLAIARSEMFR